jgi:outer membrane lipoprotein-sorting protein
MTLARTTQLFAVLILTASAAVAQKPAAGLQAALDKLDQSSATFVSAQASFKKDLYTAIVKDHELQEGITYAKRTKGAVDEVGIKINGDGARTVVYKNGEARDFTPGINCFNAYSAAKNKGTIDSLLAISFGASGKELSANWIVTDLGAGEADADGHKVAIEKLDLVPKEKGLKNNLKHIELWTDLATAISYKQIVFAPNGDITTVTLGNVLRNKTPDKAQFDIKAKACSK